MSVVTSRDVHDDQRAGGVTVALSATRARLGLIALLLALAAVAWWSTADRMSGMDAGPGTALGALGWFLGVWVVMMAAMMLPSVLPVILVLIRIGGSAHAAGFIGGYLLAWGGFSVAATLVHWALLKAALVSPMMESASVPMSAAVLAFAGLFQFMPLKHACLVRCRSPWGAVLNPSSATVATREGLRHGAFCVGCCWVLMALLFVVGVMNLLWIAVIAAYVIAEKWAPGAEWFSRAVGALLCLAAVAVFGVDAR